MLFAIPNEEERRNDYAIEMPKLASLILKHDLDAELKGLDAFAPDTPPVAPVFFAFRVMVGMGVLMLAARPGSALWRLRRGTRRRAGCCGLSPRSPSPAGSRRLPAGW